MVKLSNKEHVAAANALIQWFNSQEIGKTDANLIMTKVWAVMLSSKDMSIEQFVSMMKDHQTKLCEEIGERIPGGFRGR